MEQPPLCDAQCKASLYPVNPADPVILSISIRYGNSPNYRTLISSLALCEWRSWANPADFAEFFGNSN
jgi:hypothetical protein